MVTPSTLATMPSCRSVIMANTLEDLSRRVDSVKDEALKLTSENQVLGQYIQNLMSSSAVFQSTNSKVNSSLNK
ncbi:hypothetical protein M3Y99_00878300 [Aphelenchoides fujianensis]|nr:hypothetical protein M3Y99_00878300 [Aphelenchoides fujianensis]